MDELFKDLENEPRLLMEAVLEPVQGRRFQATGFPDLGPAQFQLPDGREMLLVESAQSMANRLEETCWDEAADDLIEDLQGLPYVKIDLGDLGTTNTILEFHRLNSPYIWSLEDELDEGGKAFTKGLRDALKVKKRPSRKKDSSGEDQEESPGVLNKRDLVREVFRYDPNSIIHGVFMEKLAGRLRLTRTLSSFIEAEDVVLVESGGVKFDRVLPNPRPVGLKAEQGFGNVPFHRTEFTAKKIVAYFNLDLALLRSYGLDPDGVDLLVALSLFKVLKFLESGLRLRSACDLRLKGNLQVTHPKGFHVPEIGQIRTVIREKIQACREKKLFAEPPVTELKWIGKK